MKSEIKEMSKLPSFILVLFGIQLIVFFCIAIKAKKLDLEILYVLLPVAIILVFFKMTVIIDAKFFKYKLFPFHFIYKEIEWKDVEFVRIAKIDAFSDFLGWGLRYSKKYGWAYIFNSSDVILLTLNNGKKLAITIKDKVGIMEFLNDNKIAFSN